MTEHTFSVVVPAHNAAATLRQCLEALYAEGGKTLEVIVVDDASTDESRAILELRYQ